MNPKALTRAAAVTIAWVAVVTIYSELSSTFKELLASIGGHHWIGNRDFLFIALLVFFVNPILNKPSWLIRR